MDFRLVLFLLIALALSRPGVSAVPVQVDPTSDLAMLYPRAGSIGLAVAVLPDPHVPRYRRIFDLGVQAITLGMLNDGYVLDRYSFPWSSTEGATPDSKPGAYGLMVFRCDGWRGHACQDLSTLAADADPASGQTTRLRAIYLVTDTATWGVATAPLICAVSRIRAQLGTAADAHDGCPAMLASATRGNVELLRFPGPCYSNGSRRTLATHFERDGVLSNILCNRPKEAKFSATLFTYAALPFFALGFAIAVSQVPGVVDWGGGLLALLKAVGLGP